MATRYFLRRLAIARRKKHASSSGPYQEALVEVILVVLGLPAVGVLSFVGLSSLTWWEVNVDKRWPWLSFRLMGIVLWVLALLVGHWWFGKRFSRYRLDPSVHLAFDTERDRHIIFWQKFAALVVCGLVMPWLGILVGRFFT